MISARIDDPDMPGQQSLGLPAAIPGAVSDASWGSCRLLRMQEVVAQHVRGKNYGSDSIGDWRVRQDTYHEPVWSSQTPSLTAERSTDPFSLQASKRAELRRCMSLFIGLVDAGITR